MRARAFSIGFVACIALAATSACSGEGDPEAPGGMGSEDGENGSGTANGVGGSRSVANFNRPPGMLIGRGASGGDDSGETGEPPLVVVPTAGAPGDDLEIPSFEPPPPLPPPCSGCVEISALVNDINQGSQFSFNAGGVAGVTRVVWTILVPFNSDQLFIRSVVNGGDGPYTFLSANTFPELNAPLPLVHQFAGTANTVGLRIGSAGAWTGNQRVSVFVDSVAFEFADPAPTITITFDADAEGMAPQGTEREPLVSYHP
jgi:hypothetical protein